MDLDDLDNELLKLNDSDDEVEKKSTASPSPPPQDSSRKRASLPPPTTMSSPKKRAATSTKKSTSKRRKREDDSEDEGEASSQYSEEMDLSKGSDGSDAELAESSDPDSDGDDYAAISNPYPLEGKYTDAADRARLAAMPMLERETILADREDEQVKKNMDRQILAAHKQKKAADRHSSRNAAGNSARRSSRTKSQPKKAEESKRERQLHELVKKREEKSSRKIAPGDGRKREATPESRSEGEESEDDEDDRVIWARDEAVPKRDPVVTLEDINRIRLGRSEVAKYWHYPNFEDIARGCFVRFNLGPDPRSQLPVYRMCQIKEFSQATRIYEIPGKNGNTRINRSVILSLAGNEKPSRMDVLSDSKITEDEFRWYTAALLQASLPAPNLKTVEKKNAEVKNLIHKSYSDAEITEMMRKRNALDPNSVAAVMRVKSLRMEREELLSSAVPDEAEISRIDRELEQLEFKTANGRSDFREETQMQRLAKMNKAARQSNTQNIRKAQLEEKKREIMAATAPSSDSGATFLDPFARVKTRAKVYHNGMPGKKDDEDAKMDDLFGSEPTSRSGTPGPNGLGEKVDGKMPSLLGGKRKKGVDEIIASLGVGIDIEI